MTSLEAYVTSLVVEQVAKYVKNIRKEDYQLSLWDGEVAFQNVELETSALQEKLDKFHLPIELISGHIHELSIHIPWASLNSEAIVVTLNTIELIIKSSKKKFKTEVRKEAKPPSDPNPGIYPRVINNIIIDCQYIILKLVDEGISLCVTVQSLQLISADESWNAAFIYIDPNDVCIRRLLRISGLNICLDKTNSDGKVEVANEPVICNCALEVRFMKEYKLATIKTTSKTKTHILLCSFDINASTVQFPLAQKLVDIILSFKSNDQPPRNEETVPGLMIATKNTQSYASWAWNMLPSIFTKTKETEIGHLVNIAIYIKELTITLRSSEFIKTRKNRYDPIFCLTIKALFLEIVKIEKRWLNSLGGFSSIIFIPYVKQSPAYFIMSEEVITEQFVKESLFDVIPKCIGHNVRTNEKFPTDINEYLNRVTLNTMVERAPAFCFDVVNAEEDTENACLSANKNSPERLTLRLSLASLPKFRNIYKTIMQLSKN